MKKKILIVLVFALGMIAEVANADFTFGIPTSLGQTVNSSYNDFNPNISADGLSLYFISNRTGGIGGTGMYDGCDIWVTTRETTDEPWGIPANLGPTINTPGGEFGVSISSDGLSLYFDMWQPGSSNSEDLYVATRATIDDDWSNPVSLGPTVNSSADDCYVNISADELALYFTSNRSGKYALWVTRRETIHDPWGTPVNLGPTVNSAAGQGHPGISSDSRVFFFTSSLRSGGYGNEDIWMTRRATTDESWGEPVNLGPTINSSVWEGFPNVSADGSTLYFRYSQTGRYQGGDIWQAPIIPIVDLNADGIVDAADMCIMVDYWGTDEPLCDIGPMPWGDGVVDVEDLKVLAEHLFEEVPLPGLIAHWKFDETEGFEAQNSIGPQNGFLFGDPIWHPAGGKKDGALELDGIDDYVITASVLNPADGAFSVFAWIKGGAPGQVIISQADGAGTGETWLGIDTLEGNLMTGLVPPSGRTPSTPLVSESMITDGNWHHIGHVWDGSCRTLYVDSTIAATDTEVLDPLEFSNGGLYFGTSKTLEAGTFFSGLIDDIRIYNQTLSPEQIATLAQ
jgi:Tol biopolymer transport system component